MPPKRSTSTGAAPRGRPAGSKNKVDKPSAASKTAKAKSADKGKGKQRAVASESPEPQEERMDVDREVEAADDEDDDNELEQEQTIPADLLTRILAEFFEKDGTRITKDANTAVAKYMDIFVKEAIARAAAERNGGFLEVRCLAWTFLRTPCLTLLADVFGCLLVQVEDLEKIAPQLLLDL